MESQYAEFQYRAGTIAWRTCFRRASIPLSVLLAISEGRSQYVSTPANPRPVMAAMETYLLLQTLSANRAHTIS